MAVLGRFGSLERLELMSAAVEGDRVGRERQHVHKKSKTSLGHKFHESLKIFLSFTIAISIYFASNTPGNSRLSVMF